VPGACGCIQSVIVCVRDMLTEYLLQSERYSVTTTVKTFPNSHSGVAVYLPQAGVTAHNKSSGVKN